MRRLGSSTCLAYAVLMPSKPLQHYLQSNRLRTGLTQTEIAFLLDLKNRDAVSKHENANTTPPLDVLLCYELLHDTPIRELFAGRFSDIEALFRERVNGLLYTLERRAESESNKLKIRTLKRVLGEEIIN